MKGFHGSGNLTHSSFAAFHTASGISRRTGRWWTDSHPSSHRIGALSSFSRCISFFTHAAHNDDTDKPCREARHGCMPDEVEFGGAGDVKWGCQMGMSSGEGANEVWIAGYGDMVGGRWKMHSRWEERILSAVTEYVCTFITFWILQSTPLSDIGVAISASSPPPARLPLSWLIDFRQLSPGGKARPLLKLLFCLALHEKDVASEEKSVHPAEHLTETHTS